MAQGEFKKAEVEEVINVVKEMFNALPKNKKGDFIGHLNDIMLFLEAAEKHAQ